MKNVFLLTLLLTLGLSSCKKEELVAHGNQPPQYYFSSDEIRGEVESVTMLPATRNYAVVMIRLQDGRIVVGEWAVSGAVPPVGHVAVFQVYTGTIVKCKDLSR